MHVGEHDNGDRREFPVTEEKRLEPKLAQRIEELRLPAWYALTPEQEWQRVYCVEYMKTGMLSTLFPIISTLILWFAYQGPFKSLTHFFLDKSFLLNLWPRNLVLIEQLSQARFIDSEISFLISMTSSVSAVWLLWLLWRLQREVRRRDTFYMRRWLPTFTVITPLICAGCYFLSFDTEYSRLGPSLTQPISIGALKIIVCMSFMYYVVAGFIEQLLLYLRRDTTVPRYPY